MVKETVVYVCFPPYAEWITGTSWRGKGKATLITPQQRAPEALLSFRLWGVWGLEKKHLYKIAQEPDECCDMFMGFPVEQMSYTGSWKVHILLLCFEIRKIKGTQWQRFLKTCITFSREENHTAISTCVTPQVTSTLTITQLVDRHGK